MKKWNVLIFGLALVLSSCGPKICQQGYTGEDCDVPVNERYNGTYTITDVCSVSGTESNVAYIAPSNDNPLQFIITGTFWAEPGIELVININSNNPNSFSSNSLPLGTSGFNIEIQNGTIEANGTISGSYTVFNGTTIVETCIFTGF